jgi:hypothetical protein
LIKNVFFFGTGTAARRNADGGSDDSSTGSTRVPPVVADPPPVGDEVIDDIDDESTVDSDNNNNNHNNVTINLVRDSIISRNTRRSYIGDLIQLFKWAIINEDPEIYDWFTAYGRAELEITFRRLEDENAKSYRESVKKKLRRLLRASQQRPFINIGIITPSKYFEFILQIPMLELYTGTGFV